MNLLNNLSFEVPYHMVPRSVLYSNAVKKMQLIQYTGQIYHKRYSNKKAGTSFKYQHA
jgi:hypothetical protein